MIAFIKKIPGLKSGVGRKLMLGILLFSSMITFIGTGLQLYLDFDHDVKLIHSTLQQVESSYLRSVTNSLWVTDDELLRIQLEGILRLPNIEFIEVRKGADVLHAAGTPQSQSTIERVIPMSYVYNGRNVNLGELHVVASLSGVYSRIFDRILVILGIQTIKTFLVSLFIFIIFYQLVGKHITAMASFAESIRFESMDQPLRLNRNPKQKKPDELDQLATSFNRMRGNLNKSFSDLKTTNLNLQAEITDRIRLEKELTASEKRFRQLAEHVNAVFWVISSDYQQIHYISPAYERVWGRSCRSLHENPGSWLDAIEPEDRRRVEASLAQISQGDIPAEINFPDYRVIRPDGDICWVSARGFPVRNEAGEVYRIVGIAENISERKQAEELLNKFFSLSLDLFCIADLDGYFKQVNPAFERVLGYSEAEILATPYIEYVHPDDQAATRAVARGLLAGMPAISFENRYRAKNGRYIWLSWTSMPDPAGGATYAVARDITAEKRAQKEKLKIEAELRQAHKMEAIGTLAGGIAHDFNNILGIIIGNTELALDDIPRWNPASANLSEIKTASMRARDVVRQLLSFSRKTEQERKPLEISAIIKESIALLRASISTTIHVRCSVADDLGTIKADPTQIHQILINLCTNAAHAMEKTGGVLDIKLSQVELDAAAASQYEDLTPGAYVRLTVSDTGPGIDETIQERIFDPYFTTKEVGKGTGMGLAIVSGIVRTHEGCIHVKSTPGKGTRVSVLFPVIAAVPVKERTGLHQLPTGSESILFVDDEVSITNIGKQTLEKLGYRIGVHNNPLEALETIRANPHHFDLVITDMTMPQMTGDVLIAEIARIRENLPVILCTGYSEKMDSAQALQSGASQYVEKPLDRRQLALVVRQVLDG